MVDVVNLEVKVKPRNSLTLVKTVIVNGNKTFNRQTWNTCSHASLLRLVNKHHVDTKINNVVTAIIVGLSDANHLMVNKVQYTNEQCSLAYIQA